jgi:NAD(P)H dehydrogenase (quinone)
MQAHFDALGVPRRHVEGSVHQAAGAWGSEEMMSYERGIREGYFAIASHHVKLLTGRPARSLRAVYETTRGALPA